MKIIATVNGMKEEKVEKEYIIELQNNVFNNLIY
jgi:hypothetical protein